MKVMLVHLMAVALVLLSDMAAAYEGYALLIDAGSTGSRSYVFHITEVYQEPADKAKGPNIDNSASEKKLLSREVEAFPGLRIKKGISSFADVPGDHLVSEHFVPMFINAAENIPKSKWASTQVFIKGTAGMRLLSEEKQEKLWTNLLLINKDNRNPFHLFRRNLGTIDGDDEAYYAVLASNYIAKSIDGRLQRVEGTEMVGALDMGGSSTQLIFYVGDGAAATTSGGDGDSDGKGGSGGKTVTQSDFWSNSWLNYGAERVRERAQDLLIHRHVSAKSSEGGVPSANAQGAEDDEPMSIANPCFQRGYSAVIAHMAEYSVGGHERHAGNFHLHGQGDPDECLQLITDVLWPEQSCRRLQSGASDAADSGSDGGGAASPCYVDNIQNPAVSGHFYAMSVYYFANDAVKTLGEPSNLEHWPTPTIFELEKAARAFCQIQWPGEPGARTSAWSKKHEYSGNSQLPHRCFETLYQAVLLEHGFGFQKDKRHVTFAMDVEGQDVEWTLGFVLANLNLHPSGDGRGSNSQLRVDLLDPHGMLVKQLKVLTHQIHSLNLNNFMGPVYSYIDSMVEMAHEATYGLFRGEL